MNSIGPILNNKGEYEKVISPTGRSKSDMSYRSTYDHSIIPDHTFRMGNSKTIVDTEYNPTLFMMNLHLS